MREIERKDVEYRESIIKRETRLNDVQNDDKTKEEEKEKGNGRGGEDIK